METGVEHLDKNSELWSRFFPQYAIQLQFLDTEGYEFCKTDVGECNLKKDDFYYHSQEGAEQEAKAWFESLDLSELRLLIVYGVGLGYYYQAAKEWLKEDKSRRFAFIENDFTVIAKFLETGLATEFLSDSQARLFFFNDLMEDHQAFEKIYLTYPDFSFKVASLKAYENRDSTFVDELVHKLIHDANIKSNIIHEYNQCGLVFYRNFYKNILLLPNSYRGNNFFGTFENVPAIICGAGPSITKHLEQLGELKTRALIFAGGSGLNALSGGGVLPHFGMGIDPNSPQLDRYLTNKAYELPFFYKNRVYHEALKVVHGPKLMLTGAEGYDGERLLEERLGFEGKDLPEGFNVINALIALAHEMGCNPIILVGMDLAYTGERSYASGVESEDAFSFESFEKSEQFRKHSLVRDDIYGQPVRTLWKWVVESQYISDYAKKHSEITIINATEGGIGMKGVKNIPLNEAVQQHCNHQKDFKSIINGLVQISRFESVTDEKIHSLIEEIRSSLSSCQLLLEMLLQETAVMTKKIENDKNVPNSLNTSKAALAETELGDEVAFQYILNDFNLFYNWMLQSELDQIKQEESEVVCALKRLEAQDKKYRYLLKVIEVQLIAIQHALEEEN